MRTSLRYTTADLDGLPSLDGVRYEIIDGDLYVSRQPDWHHQRASSELYRALEDWNDETGAGLAIEAPGVVFAPDDNVAPDVVWIRRAQIPHIFDDSGHLRAAPALVVEVLSPGPDNERRDRDLKLKLYSRQGVQEYWLVSWQLRTVQIYRRADGVLELVTTLVGQESLTSPLLPGFACTLTRLWAPTW
jgi:Uma2 family endonuclease